jgi:DNA polymerase-4
MAGFHGSFRKRARRLRENGFCCKTLQISVRDKDLSWFECQTKLASPCCTVEDIAGAAMVLFGKHYNFSKPLRSLGVRACDLIGMSEGVAAILPV